MIPGLLANEVSAALREFIVTGFETETSPFKGEFRRLVEEQQEGEAFLKGPYVSVGLPFIHGTSGKDFFQGFETEYPPFAHQEQAWNRLASNKLAANTLVATGTGSGKTECFLYPILDHCQRTDSAGIKAIIIYPMNALATDQAKRFADIIHTQAGLKGLRVGLFVGGGDSGSKMMGAKQVITDKDELRNNPPDILLTNYKMLDYLLMRPKDQKLWSKNGPDTLRYLVVDELHTFDGAQGTDLSLLLRRLRARFQFDERQLICVGTSATLGDEGSADNLLNYASDIFSSTFSRDAVIAEQRQSDAEFLDDIHYLNLNSDIGPNELRDALGISLASYLETAYELYFSEKAPDNLEDKSGRIDLGKKLRQHGQVANLLRKIFQSSETPSFQILVKRLVAQIPKQFEHSPEQALLALLALMSHARAESGLPFVQLRLQLWTRELRRIVATLREPDKRSSEDTEQVNSESASLLPPLLSFGDDKPPKDQVSIRLPLVQCNECHGTAWLARMELSHPADQQIETDLSEIYQAFFANHEETSLLMPWQSGETHTAGGANLEHFRVCRQCGQTAGSDYQGDCKACQADNSYLVRVSRPNQLRETRQNNVNRTIHRHDCPYCQSESALVVFGARAASLSAVAIHQLFSSRDNDDRKLLTFSDSVQDATHRAGFFAARTWKNNIRMGLTQLLNAQQEPIPISDLPDLFEAYWLKDEEHQGRLDLAAYLREFMPPDQRFRSDFEAFEEFGEVTNPRALLRLIRQRALWEALEDTSWRSQVGRSLNRVGVAALDWPTELVQEAAKKWKDVVFNKLGYEIDEDKAFSFLNGLMQHLVNIGAIGLKDLELYRLTRGGTYLLNKISYASSYGPGSTRPRFPSEALGDAYQIVFNTKNATWFNRWLLSVNPDSGGLINKEQIEQVLYGALEALVDTGLAQIEQSTNGHRVWSLKPENLFITNNIMSVQADGYRPMNIPANKAELWLGVPTLDATSIERKYERVQSVRNSLYSTLYSQGEIHRVIAHEHTGLLPAPERIRVENSFMDGKNPWEYNLLSATPTLEMGIDIGSLSSVLLCSVPPAQANYLQRVGRGGRKDGNSFVLTVANGRPHDLVFYADPARMLDTPVEPPAVFLKARHVLRRQLLAYALDSWTRDLSDINAIPGTMQPVLDAVEATNTEKFPYNLLNYLKKNMQEIWDGFSAYVATELGEEDREILRQYLFGGPAFKDDHLQLYVLSRLKVVTDERKSWTEMIENLNKEIKNLKKKPQDDHTKQAIEEMEREVQGYRGLRIKLNKRETLNFFTDEGLLPNYAFPEEGTTLHSVIFRTETGGQEGAEREYVKWEYEYQRPAQAALTELAPDSIFYAGNRKVRIERVDTAKGRNIQDWRFCPRCHYSATSDNPNSGFAKMNCPRCGTAQWGDQSARTKMLKMTQVYAFTNAKEAVLDDRSDSREPVFFSKQMLIDFDPTDISITWVLDDKTRPFGFEFIRTSNFLEVNFGRREGDEMMFDIAGEHLQRPGFQICKECGSVQHRNKDPQHLKSCSFSKGPVKGADGEEETGVANCLYLYRQFSSEALRILLPRLSTGGTEEQVHSFVAALQLGLKRRFGGKVDHLRVAYQSEPLGETEERRHFIVLYDSVPGGTGYLHELLSRAENMQSVFELAYKVMSYCDCYGNTLDGCYRCLLEYRNAYGMESTSKQLAMEMLGPIVAGDYDWVQSDSTLSGLKSNPWLDSELEARFPEAVAAYSGAECIHSKKVRVTQDVIRGKIGHRIIIGDLIYDLEPQVELGSSDGVQFASKPDFVAWPTRQGHTPIAIFLDGYEYHKDIVTKDLIKRLALMRAGFCVWSLNWYDVNKVIGDKAQDVPMLSALTSPEHHHAALTELARRADISNVAEHLTKTSFELLMHFLAEQDSQSLAKQALFFAFQSIPAKALSDEAIKKTVIESLKGLPASFTDLQPKPEVLVGSVGFNGDEGAASLNLSLIASPDLLSKVDITQAMATVSYELEPGGQSKSLYAWQRLWLLVNYLQFLPVFYAYTPESVYDGTAAGLLWNLQDSSAAAADSELPDWFAYLDETVAQTLSEVNYAWPVQVQVGEEVENEQGEIIGEIELALTHIKIAYVMGSQPNVESVLLSDGWQVFASLEDFINALTTVDTGV